MFLVNLLTLFTLIHPLIVKYLLDNVLIEQNLSLLTLIMIGLISIIILQTISGIIIDYLTSFLSLNITYDIQEDLFKHIEELDLSFFGKYKVGDLLIRMEEDTVAILDFIDILFYNVFVNGLTVIYILVLTLVLDWKLAIVVLATVPLYIIIQKYFGAKIEKRFKKLKKYRANIFNFVQERLNEIKSIKLFTTEEKELSEFKSKTKKYMKEDLHISILQSILTAVMSLISLSIIVFVLWYGGYQVIIGAATIGTVIAIYTYMTQLFDPLNEMANAHVDLKKTNVSLGRIFEVLKYPTRIKQKKKAKKISIKGKISFNDVSFGYDPKNPVLQNISFSSKPGEHIGFVGESGAGKSTIINLIYRFYDPIKGNIKIDNKDLKNLHIKSLRSQLGIVDQEPHLFNKSISANIALAKPNASLREIQRAAKLAQIHNFIDQLPDKYDTVIGEEGFQLSGGQKQRLAIARMILKDPKIVLLDEPTSALDPRSEEIINKAMNNLTRGKTTFIIAHKLSTLKSANKILVVKDHTIKEQGTFKNLIKKKQNFFKLYSKEFRSTDHFELKLDTEIKRLQRTKKPLSLVSFIIKGGNESIYNKIESFLNQNTRKKDFVAQYEKNNVFFILLPGLNKKNANLLIKDLKKKLKKTYNISGYWSLAGLRIDGKTVEELISFCLNDYSKVTGFAKEYTKKKEINCRITRTIIKYVEAHHPKKLPELLQHLNVDKEYLLDTDNWVSYEIQEMFFRRLIEITKDPDIPRKIGMEGYKKEHLGILATIVKKVGSPIMAYNHIKEISQKFSKVGEFQVVSIKPGKCILNYKLKKSHTMSREVCEYIQGIVSAIPLLWFKKPAEIKEIKCAAKGAPYCTYELTWKDYIQEEVSNLVFQSLFHYLERKKGKKAVEKLCDSVGIYREDFEKNWGSHKLFIDLLNEAVKISKDTLLPTKVGQEVAKVVSFSPLVRIIKYLASVKTAYSSLPRFAKKLTNISTVTLKKLEEDHAIVQYQYKRSYEFDKNIDLYLQGILASLPTAWKKPAAKVIKKQKGLYDITWKN